MASAQAAGRAAWVGRARRQLGLAGVDEHAADDELVRAAMGGEPAERRVRRQRLVGDDEATVESLVRLDIAEQSPAGLGGARCGVDGPDSGTVVIGNDGTMPRLVGQRPQVAISRPRAPLPGRARR